MAKCDYCEKEGGEGKTIKLWTGILTSSSVGSSGGVTKYTKTYKNGHSLQIMC